MTSFLRHSEIANLDLPPRLRRRMLLLGAGGLLGLPDAAGAQTAPAPAGKTAEITVDRARTEPIPIAIPNLAGGSGDTERYGRDIAGVITNNLSHSGLFRAISPSAFIAGGTGDAPAFANWKAIGAQALVTGKVDSAGGDKLRVEFRLWDVLPGQQIQGTAYTTTTGNWRRIAHIISDVIYERMLGEKGYFDTRIAYVAGSGPRDRRTKRLAIMDQDGENNRFLTDGSFIVKTPRFNPVRDQLAFMSFVNNKPRVFLFDLGSGRQQMLGNFEGITLSPRFTPDGASVIMAQTNDAGGSDIFVVGAGGGARRLTSSGGAINVAPCFSPDGSQICFESDRGGDQQIYVMDAGGGGAKRISFGSGRYATPVWSPRGDLIAFTHMGGSGFAIGVMRPDGSGERILSESFYCEGPTFAPNGRVLAFWRETAARDARGSGFSARIVSIDIAGFNERPLVTPTDGSEPAWGPLLQ